ncbi:MAG: FAD-binding oxidoreductase [Roseovarius sp.]
MNLLYANDRRGEYPDSWYAATATPLDRFAPLQGETRADVCVVGAGYTGLSAALHLAEAGLDVVLLEAQRVGFGASGRNGGQLGSGQRMEQTGLEQIVGREDAAKLWELAEDAKGLVKALVARHQIDCHLTPGVAHACFTPREAAAEHAYADHLAEHYGYDRIEKLDQGAMRALCPSPAYRGGTLDMGAGHLHPLAYAFGLARAAKAAGVRVHEGALVRDIAHDQPARVITETGAVRADHVILACNGYLGGLDARVAAKVMPINNFIAATEPLGDEAARVLTRHVAVADSKFVINYFRLSHDRRLLFGGGESYGYRFPRDIASVVRKPMVQIFPHLAETRIDHAWGGTLAITMKRMPYLARLAPNVLSASGYSGHGVGTATHAGKLMADAVRGQAEGFETLSRVPAPAFPGGAAFRTPLLVLAMTWFSLRDRLGL